MEFRHTDPRHRPHRHITVPLLRALASDFNTARARSSTDPLKVPRLIKATVANAASAIHFGNSDDGPLRKREYLWDEHDDDDDEYRRRYGHGAADGGADLIHSTGSIAAPNVITANLDAYIQGILRTSHKDQPELGARRIWVLWSGDVGELAKMTELATAKRAAAMSIRRGTVDGYGGYHPSVYGQSQPGSAHPYGQGYTHGHAHARKNSRGTDTEGEGTGYGPAGVKAAAAEAMRRTGTALKGMGKLVPTA